jgi:CheY-like chemotaxis protein
VARLLQARVGSQVTLEPTLFVRWSENQASWNLIGVTERSAVFSSILSGRDSKTPRCASYENRDRPSLKVLIVDDLQSDREGLAELISGWGFTAETAENGQDALDKLAAFSPDLIVLDLMMPTMDGFELMHRLGATGNMPLVIVVTAFSSIQLAIHTVHDLGAFWYFEKPVKPAVLLELLNLATPYSRKGGPDKLSCVLTHSA